MAPQSGFVSIQIHRFVIRSYCRSALLTWCSSRKCVVPKDAKDSIATDSSSAFIQFKHPPLSRPSNTKFPKKCILNSRSYLKYSFVRL